MGGRGLALFLFVVLLPPPVLMVPRCRLQKIGASSTFISLGEQHPLHPQLQNRPEFHFLYNLCVSLNDNSPALGISHVYDTSTTSCFYNHPAHCCAASHPPNQVYLCSIDIDHAAKRGGGQKRVHMINELRTK